MECKNALSARIKRMAVLCSIITTGVVTTSCGKDYAGGAEGARRELPSADELAFSSEPLTLAVRYVAFQDSSGGVTVDEGTARSTIDGMNSYWAQCGISYVMEAYEAIDPSTIGGRYSPSSYSQIDAMRMAMQSDRDILVMATGPWVRGGSLGSSNCYSSFPGDAADGIICEKKSADGRAIMAHEVGHWLNLRHTDNPSTDYVDDTTSSTVSYNLMDHVVATYNDRLTEGQCQRARRAIGEHRRNAVM